MVHKVLVEPAFVLHSRPYRNTSLIIDVFTEHHGRQALVARSARGIKSRYQGRLQAFVPLVISYSGQHELKNLSAAELAATPYDLVGNHMMCGFYLNELLVRLLQKGDEHHRIYQRYKLTLQALTQQRQVEVALRLFEKTLLIELGYGLNLSSDAVTSLPLDSHASYRFVPEQGFVLLQQPVAADDVFVGASILALRDECWSSAEQLSDAKRLMRSVLAYYLGSRPLKSRECL
jgi:DNA repair protein RecO (recombination protein O)